MLAHHIRLALRTLRRDRGYALLNGVGLAVALACCLLVGMFVRAERSVDTFHPDVDRLRAVTVSESNASETDFNTPRPLAAALMEYEAVDQAVTVRGASVSGIRVPGREGLFDADVNAASPGYFDLFGFDLVLGDRQRLMDEPGIVLTEATAHRLFGDADPMGQTLRLERWRDTLNVAVTGIMADSSGRSVLDAEALLTFASLPLEEREKGWDWRGPATYLRLAPGATDADLAPVFRQIAATHYAEAETPPEFDTVPLAERHLSDLSPASGFRGDAGLLRLFTIIAAFVLLLGVINYVNLATARATRRAREVGVRKTLGASRWRVAAQFWAEAVVLAVFAGLAATALAAVLQPGFNALFGADLGRSDLDVQLLGSALGLAVGTGLVAGLYPALVLSGFQPITALRGTVARGRASARVRQVLVVTQLVVAVGLLSGTGVVLRQLAFAQSEDPGYEADGLVVVDIGEARLAPQWASTLDAVRRVPGVQSAVATWSYPTRAENFLATEIDGQPAELRVVQGEPEYLEVLGARLLAGRLLDERESDRTSAVVLNEAAVRELGWGTPAQAVGRKYEFNGEATDVVGVVEDQHMTSFHAPIDPMQVSVARGFSDEPPTYSTLLVRLNPGQVASGVDGIRAAIRERGAEADPGIEFLDEAVAGMYEAERRLGGVLGAFAGIAILIACLGLFGLAAYTAERRTKEIGVRRVLGATVGQIVRLLTREYVVLVTLAAGIAVPATVLVMGDWLEGFAYHTSLDPALFILAIALALAFALLAVGGQALQAASAPPARALRSD